MDEFDKEFEAAPTPDEFDAMFEAAPAVEKKPSYIDRLSEIANKGIEPAKKAGEYISKEIAEPIALGAAQGATLGFADEATARINQFLDPLISKLSGESAVNEQLRKQGFQIQEEPTTYEKELEKTRGMFKSAEKTSPWLYGAAEFGSSIPAGNVLGGALGVGKVAEGAGKLARIGSEALKAAPGVALEAYGYSEGSLLGDEAKQEQALKDIAIGGTIGGVAGGGVQAITDVAVPAVKKTFEPITEAVTEYVGDSPFLRQIKRAYEKYGKEYGVSPTSESAIQRGVPGVEGGVPFSKLNLERSGELIGELENTRSILGQNVEQSITNNLNTKLDLSEPVRNFSNLFNDVRRTLPGITEDPKVMGILNQLSNVNYKSLNPVEVKSLMNDLSNIIERNASSKYGSMELDELTGLLSTFRKDVDNVLKQQIPEYAAAASDYTKFMNAFYETPIAGKYDPKMKDVFFGNLKGKDLKLTQAYETLIEDIADQTATGSQTAISNLMQAANELKQSGVKLGFDPDQFIGKLKEYADDAALRRNVLKTQESQAGGKLAAKQLVGLGETGRAAILMGAQKAGQISKKVSQKLYQAPKEALLPLATRLENSPGLGRLGTALRDAVEKNDSFAKNVALFSILTNPNAKLLVESEDETGF